MKRGGKVLCGVALVAIAACGKDAKLEIRSTPTPVSAVEKPVPLRIAEARAQFALGNVALALESFRKGARDDPSSTDALAGIAACYDRMGRFELSRRYYESALALAPADPQLLGAFAASLDLQGRRDEAASVRREIAQRLAAAPAAAPAKVQVAQALPPLAMPIVSPPMPVAKAAPKASRPAPVSAAGTAVAAAPTPVVATPAAAAAPVAATAVPAPAAEQPAAPPAAVQQPPRPVLRAPASPAAEPVRVAQAQPVMIADSTLAAVATMVKLEPIVEPEVGQSVTVRLPDARPAAATPAPQQPAKVAFPQEPAPAPAAPEARAEAALRPDPVPVPAVPAKPERMAAARAEDRSGPRIERLSMGEVALITTDRPRWRAQTAANYEASSKVRFVPLREANAQPTRVRVLNAARVNRLAARTRAWLTARGWARMAIGDAPAVRSRSLILYPPGQRELAQTLSNQFGFDIEERSDARFVTMLLGRDAARIEELRPRSA